MRKLPTPFCVEVRKDYLFVNLADKLIFFILWLRARQNDRRAAEAGAIISRWARVRLAAKHRTDELKRDILQSLSCTSFFLFDLLTPRLMLPILLHSVRLFWSFNPLLYPSVLLSYVTRSHHYV